MEETAEIIWDFVEISAFETCTVMSTISRMSVPAWHTIAILVASCSTAIVVTKVIMISTFCDNNTNKDILFKTFQGFLATHWKRTTISHSWKLNIIIVNIVFNGIAYTKWNCPKATKGNVSISCIKKHTPQNLTRYN